MRLSERFSLKGMSSITHKLILALMGFNILVLLTLPMLVQRILLTDLGYGYSATMTVKAMYLYVLVLLYLGGIMAFIVLNDLRLIFKSCLLEDVFNKVNIKRLERMATTLFFIFAIFTTKIFIVNSFMTMIIVFVFFMASIFCFVLALVFDKSVLYKEEIDLTI